VISLGYELTIFIQQEADGSHFE